ncbi:phosphotransferase [Candidatus Dependentiae bacterium]|nr:phosphotransferase [Candidatus Dependentiae bacterium]
MSQQWSAEFKLEPNLAKHLIESQFPQLKPVMLEFIGEGWDNVAYRVNRNYLFRFPRRQMGADLVDVEWNLLHALAQRLPLPIPKPLFYGKPSKLFKWPFLGYYFLEGKSACGAGLTMQERVHCAEPLAQFLKVLHAIDETEALKLGAGSDVLEKLNMHKRLPLALKNIEKIRELGLFQQCDRLQAMLENLKNVTDTGRKVLVHSDLYARHFLINEKREICGVIDWGDVRIASPAVDLQLIFSFLPQQARSVFLETYGTIDEQTEQLALARALLHTLSIVVYAHDVDDQDLLAEGLVGLQLLVDVGCEL